MKSLQIKNPVKCEFHSHSHHSHGSIVTAEGLNSPAEMVEGAKRAGLDCIALTDHDQTTGNNEAVKAGKKLGITVIPGEEITTLGVDRKNRGHILALGIQEPIKPGLSVEETIDKIHEQAGVAIAAHPFDISRRGIRKKSVLCDAIEAFNAINIERIANWRTIRFSKIKNMTAVTGTDAHFVQMLGYSYTLCDADRSGDMDAVLKAIKKGRVQMHCRYVPANITTAWSVVRLQKSYDNVEKYIKKNYFYPKRVVALELLRIVKKSPGRIDHLINFIGKVGIASATGYSAMKLLFGV